MPRSTEMDPKAAKTVEMAVLASRRTNSEMPRLRHYLKVTVLTWLLVVAIASALGGILTARSSTMNVFESFLGGTVIFLVAIVLPSLAIVAVYSAAALLVRRRGIVGASLRVALAIASAIPVIGLIVGFDLPTTEELSSWQWIRSAYGGWLFFALCLAPVLVFVHGRIK